jgi:hypothetical protein
MRPAKSTLGIKELATSQLKAELKKKGLTPCVKTNIENELKERNDKTFEMIQRFFNPRHNKYLLLAQYQLYREGKAKIHGVGTHRRFYVESQTVLFDKMIEVKNKYDKWMTKKRIMGSKINEEFQAWKR